MLLCKLKAAKWTGEPVEVFANKLRRMVRGCGLEKEGLEQVVKLTFTTGLLILYKLSCNR